MRILPVGLTMIWEQVPLMLRILTRLALAVPLGENEIFPALEMTVPRGRVLVAWGTPSLLVV